jgi:outer membrane protein assembly factor BamB
LFAAATGYEQVSAPVTVNVEAGKQVVATVLLRRTRLRYGDVAWARHFDYASVNGLAVADDWLYLTASEGNVMSLYRMEHNGRSPMRIAPLPVKGGLAFVGDQLWGIEWWPGRLYRVELDGRSTHIRRLPLDWPRGLAFDGRSLWFLDAGGPENRYGVYAIDPKTGDQKAHLSCGDNRIAGIAVESAEEGGRLWVSSLTGEVYEIDPARAGKTDKLEDGIVRKFPGWYDHLSYHRGTLWGVDNGAKRICIININQQE